MSANTGYPRKALPTQGRVLTWAAPLYDLLQPLITLGREKRLYERMVEALAPQEGERVLDVGCGTGLLTGRVASRLHAGEVIGIDASVPMIEVARRKRSSAVCRFEVALAESLPFEDGAFDAVVSALFFHHVPLDLKRRSAEELVRVLRPGGRVVVADLVEPWSFFGKFYAYSGWLVLRQPEIKENIDGRLTPLLCEAGVESLVPGYGTLGCIRVYSGRRPIR